MTATDRLRSGGRPLLGYALVVLTLAAWLLSADRAHANGRFPYAQQLREPAPGSLVVAGTYGLLLSANSGRDFQFVCESSLFGKVLMGSWLDPLLEALPDGTLVSGSQSVLRVSRDRGCSFESDWSLPHNPNFLAAAPGATGGNGSIVDVCPSYDVPNGVLALATSYAADNTTLEHRIYRSGDGARTWARLGAAIPVSMARVVLTLDAAPSKPSRIYVSGSGAQGHVVVVSDDAGATWTARPILLDGMSEVDGVFIGAVSPSDPQRVYLRARRAIETDDGSNSWDDSLIVSDDGGVGFREVLRRRASLLGFALSQDGAIVTAGYGDPRIAPIIVTDADLGIYGASAASLDFEQVVPDVAVSCLRWSGSGLYACAKEVDPLGVDPSGTPDFHVGVWKGSGLPKTIGDFTPLLKLRDVRGPLPGAGALPSSCLAEWSSADPANPGGASVCQTFNACARAETTPLSMGAIECGAGTGGSSGVSGAAGSGATAAFGGNWSQAGTTVAGAAGNPPATDASGCGCRVRSRGDHLFGTCCALTLALLSITRRVRLRSTRIRAGALRSAPPRTYAKLPGRSSKPTL